MRKERPTAHRLTLLLGLLLALDHALAYGVLKKDYLNKGYLLGRKTATPSPDVLSQKHIAMTQRQTISMPSETPMVPWRVSTSSSAFYSLLATNELFSCMSSLLRLLASPDPRLLLLLHFNSTGTR